jgi:hypothetical protein
MDARIRGQFLQRRPIGDNCLSRGAVPLSRSPMLRSALPKLACVIAQSSGTRILSKPEVVPEALESATWLYRPLFSAKMQCRTRVYNAGFQLNG